MRRSPVFYTRSKISRISRPPLFHHETNDDINLIVAVVRNESDFIVKNIRVIYGQVMRRLSRIVTCRFALGKILVKYCLNPLVFFLTVKIISNEEEGGGKRKKKGKKWSFVSKLGLI